MFHLPLLLWGTVNLLQKIWKKKKKKKNYFIRFHYFVKSAVWSVLVARKKWALWIIQWAVLHSKGQQRGGGCGVGWILSWGMTQCCFLLSASHHVNYRIWLSSGPQYLSSLCRMRTNCQWEEKDVCLCLLSGRDWCIQSYKLPCK